MTTTREAPTLQTADPHLSVWLSHIKALASDIGPRGSTTAGERAGSDYCQHTLDALGLAPQMEGFKSATSIFVPHLLAAVLMLLAFAIYPLFGRVSAILAAAISWISLVSQLLELGFRDNLFRRLAPKAGSQNVVAVTPPAGEHRQDLILIGHVDSQRTPLVFRTPTWVKVYQTFTTVAFVLSLAQALLYVAGAITQWAWIWPVTISERPRLRRPCRDVHPGGPHPLYRRRQRQRHRSRVGPHPCSALSRPAPATHPCVVGLHRV